MAVFVYSNSIEEGAVTGCLLEAREHEDWLFWSGRVQPEDVGKSCVIAKLNGYAIIPRERYEELLSRVDFLTDFYQALVESRAFPPPPPPTPRPLCGPRQIRLKE